MISKINYLLLSTMMVAAIDSTFGRGCDCCKKLCADKDSNGPSINSEYNNTPVKEKLIKWNEALIHNDINTNIHDANNFIKNIVDNNNFYDTNENNNFSLENNFENNNNSNQRQLIQNNNDTNKDDENEKKGTLYFKKIEKTAIGEKNIKKCFNGTWYKECGNKVLSLQRVNESGSNVLSVTGSDNDWVITDQGKVLESASCNPNNNKWIIVKVTTLQEGSECVGDSFVFYVDEIKIVSYSNVFDGIKCYSIEIIAANTSDVQSMRGLFYHVESALEQNMEEGAGPGFIGLDKLNVENVTDIVVMFCNAIFKQATLEQLKKWRFSGEKDVSISGLFSSKVGGLNFRVLDDWSKAKKSETVIFITNKFARENVFASRKQYNFTAPIWYDNIEETK